MIAIGPLILGGIVCVLAGLFLTLLAVDMLQHPGGRRSLCLFLQPYLEGVYGDRNLSIVNRTRDSAELVASQYVGKVEFRLRVFRIFGSGDNFNPMVVLFRPLRRGRIFRFLPAFKEWKHGNGTSLE